MPTLKEHIEATYPTEVAAMDTIAIANALNQPDLADPAPAPAPFTLNDIMGLVAPANRAKVDTAAIIRIGELSDEQNRADLGLWIQISLDKGWITGAEATACQAKLAETTPRGYCMVHYGVDATRQLVGHVLNGSEQDLPEIV